jgi:hypothetical protein
VNLVELIDKTNWKQKWHRLGKLSLRQSSIRQFRYCPRKFYHDYVAPKKVSTWKKPGYFIMGTYFHAMCEELLLGVEPEPERLLVRLFEEEGNTEADFSDVLHRVGNRELFYGDSLNDLARKTTNFLSQYGLTPERLEKKERLSFGKMDITGTPDIVARHKGSDQRYVLDIKTSGLWKKFFGTGSLSAVTYDIDQITFATQLQHYDWMLYRLYGIKADWYGYICPVNFIGNTSGKNKGKMRGDPLMLAPAASESQILHIYEGDLYGTAREISRCLNEDYFPRSRPETFGKLDCVKCQHRDVCLGQREMNFNIPDFINEDVG